MKGQRQAMTDWLRRLVVLGLAAPGGVCVQCLVVCSQCLVVCVCSLGEVSARQEMPRCGRRAGMAAAAGG